MSARGADTERDREGCVGPRVGWRRAVRRTPPVLVGALVGAAALLLVALPGTTGGGSTAGALRLLVWCGAWIGFNRWRDREEREAMGPSSALDREIAERVVRTGVFPESRARDEQVRRLLERRRCQDEREHPATIAGVVVFGGGILVAGVVAGHAAQVVGAAVALVVVPVLLVGWARRTRDRYARIDAALQQREPA